MNVHDFAVSAIGCQKLGQREYAKVTTSSFAASDSANPVRQTPKAAAIASNKAAPVSLRDTQ
ncbi:hypothetical protein IE4803_PB00403 (plasmid) [Rhizobium etli bv. phaseoli str. IE4803]|nr:hypothetical protein IE4803_PB00403 [Rhizobium etli bv. phaseoli str. IE4803]ARO26985.1 hypothetical protein TAL182_PC00385 [Rhizobium sp. TAL182]